MSAYLVACALIGIAVDIWFIKTEYEGKMALATALKGTASLFFVLFGLICYLENASTFGALVLSGLVLGMLGDIFLNLRNCFEGSKSMKIFAVGILFFLSGHFLYIASLLNRDASVLGYASLVTAVLSLLSIPPLMKRITAPSRGLRIFGWVYLVVVIAMFSSSLVLLFINGGGGCEAVFTTGALLFVVSDFIMIYYSFGRKIKPLRAVNLLSYYIGQLLIALTILLA